MEVMEDFGTNKKLNRLIKMPPKDICNSDNWRKRIADFSNNKREEQGEFKGTNNLLQITSEI